MKYNCNYDNSIGCTLCKYQSCPLIEPSNQNLSSIQKEIQFKLNRLAFVNDAIITLKQNIKAIELGMVKNLPIPITECDNMINGYRLEKKQLISEIRELRKREATIIKILKRRMGK